MATCAADRCIVPQPTNMSLIEVWERVAPELRRLVRAWGLDAATTEDLLQDVYVTASQKCPVGLDAVARRLWLLKVTANRCRLEFRRRRRWKTALLRWGQLLFTDTAATNPARECDEQRELIRRAIDDLEPTLRMVLMLRYYLDLNSTQISEILDMPDATVRSHLRKARWRLAAELRRTGFEP